jgi:hypothetical protein
MEEKKLDENKKRLDLKKYEPIQDIETVDLIMQEMKENKIYPSDALRGVILTKINKLKVQKYLVEKFQETRNKIEHRISKRNNNNKEVKK